MTLSHGAGLRLLIIALALLIGLQIVTVGTSYFLRAADLGHPARSAIVEQVAAAAQLIEELPQEKRAGALRAVNSPFIRFTLMDSYPDAAAEGEPLPAYQRIVRAYRLGLRDRPFRTIVRGKAADDEGPRFGRRLRLRAPEILIVVKLADGKALVAEPNPQYRRQMAINGFALLSAIVGVVLLGALVWASFATSRPLEQMAAAAERLAADLDAPPMREEGPKPVRNLAHALNRMQGDIRKLVSERTVTLAAVAHDFRTYLTRLRLRAEYIEDEDQRGKAVRDLDEMTALIDDTLLFASKSERTVELAPIDIAALVRGAVETLRESGAEAAFAGAQGPMTARAHEPSIRRALANLLDNAIKYGARAQAVVRRDSDSIIVTVSDEGAGVPADELARLTEPFYRAETSRSRKTGGAGLGLAITKMLVETSGGAFVLRNRPGGGLEAEIRLPAHRDL